MALNSTGLTATVNITAPQLVSNIGIGTAPFVVTSTTQVANLNAATATALATTRAINGTNFDGSAPITVPVNNANDASNADYFSLFTSTQGGNYAGLTSTGLKYHPSTGILTATGFSGPLTGNVTGNASGTAATVTGAAQTNITSVGTLTGLNYSGALACTSTSSQLVQSFMNDATTGWFQDTSKGLLYKAAGASWFYMYPNDGVIYIYKPIQLPANGGLKIMTTAFGGGLTLATNGTNSTISDSSGAINLSPTSNVTINKPVFLTGLGAASAGTTVVLVAGTNEVRPLLSTKEQKDNIIPLDFDSSAVLKLQPVSFNWKGDGSRDFGLIAEDTYEILPILANLDDKGKPISIKYYTLSVLLLDQMKKMDGRIQEQQKEIDDLKARLDRAGIK
jgi:hypothetical protein